MDPYAVSEYAARLNDLIADAREAGLSDEAILLLLQSAEDTLRDELDPL